MSYMSDWNEADPDESKLGRAEPNWPICADERDGDLGTTDDGKVAYSQNPE